MALVKLILREEVINLGEAGQLVEVKPGYARNYLLPKGKADLASEGRVRELEHQRRVIAEKLARELTDLNALRDKIAKTPLEVVAKAGEEGKLFGSVTPLQIAELLQERGITIDRRRIGLKEHIKQVGEYDVPIRLHSQVAASVKVTVKAEDGPGAPLASESSDAVAEDVEDVDDIDDIENGATAESDA